MNAKNQIGQQKKNENEKALDPSNPVNETPIITKPLDAVCDERKRLIEYQGSLEAYHGHKDKENMNEPTTIENGNAGQTLPPAHGSADNLRLSNDAKIRACNFFHAMQKHLGDCDECCLYLYHGDGDLCEAGKTILARELVYTDMSIELPPNRRSTRAMCS